MTPTPSKKLWKLAAAALVLALLAGAWFYGDPAAPPESATAPSESATAPPESATAPSEAEAAPSEAATAPSEPATAPSESGDDSFTVTLTVRCDTLLDNLALLDADKHELVPADGVIFGPAQVTVYPGESVFNLLQRAMKQAKIHLAFQNTPVYNSAYIEAIGNLYVADAGPLSGWLYRVNGQYPGYGCSRHILAPGDDISWHYTCDLGRDLGLETEADWQKDA